MTLKCVECGRIALKLNAEKKCEQCAKKDASMNSYFTKLFFINENLRETGAGNLIVTYFAA